MFWFRIIRPYSSVHGTASYRATELHSYTQLPQVSSLARGAGREPTSLFQNVYGRGAVIHFEKGSRFERVIVKYSNGTGKQVRSVCTPSNYRPPNYRPPLRMSLPSWSSLMNSSPALVFGTRKYSLSPRSSTPSPPRPPSSWSYITLLPRPIPLTAIA